MYIYPAIDIIGGKAVRLTKGDYSTAEIMDKNPRGVARAFKMAGATRMHIVDLDGAKDGSLSNFSLIADIVRECGMFVEVGGGIRNLDRIESYIKAGVSRVILGTAAVEDFGLVAESVKSFGDKIAVGIDCKDGYVATRGWKTKSEVSGLELANRCVDAGVSAVIYTDIDTDGAMNGTNLEAFYKLTKIKGLNVIASGGVSAIDEVKLLRSAGVEGVIIGKALYFGLIDLGDALAAARGE